MKIVYHLSGTTLFEENALQAPAEGETVQFRTNTYKKGLYGGSLISVEVGGVDPVRYEPDKDNPSVVYVSANGYNIIEEGPRPPDK